MDCDTSERVEEVEREASGRTEEMEREIYERVEEMDTSRLSGQDLPK